MDFSNDKNILNGIYELDRNIEHILKGRNTYSVKFAVKEFYESLDTNIDLYAAPPNHHFRRKEINLLKELLEKFIFEHYQRYQPECYFLLQKDDLLPKCIKKCVLIVISLC
ncbi:hypothetical protein A4G19_07890 [Pasteurellaceae bacterium Macca]|nr:hypothetical protein [Pasteurellaceae bacterium Macca]